MPRQLTAEPNVLKLRDHISNSTIVLYYRTPTAKEQAAYTNGMTKRVRNKLINCTGEQRQTKGAEILAGFREGDFLKPDGSVISSDPKSPKYDPEWKNLLIRYAPDLIETLAIHAFEQTASLDDDEELDAGGDVTDPN